MSLVGNGVLDLQGELHVCVSKAACRLTGRALPNAARHGVGHGLLMCPIRIGHRVGTGGRALSLGMGLTSPPTAPSPESMRVV